MHKSYESASRERRVRDLFSSLEWKAHGLTYGVRNAASLMASLDPFGVRDSWPTLVLWLVS